MILLPDRQRFTDWMVGLMAEADAAQAAISAELTRAMFPIYSGPMTREEDAGVMVYLLLQMTGAYGTVYSEEESEEDYY